MIKLIAAITMLIDHIGALFFPKIPVLRIIGRIAMPLFGFSVARGFYYSEKNQKIKKYLKNLLIFSVISQIPFTFFVFKIANKWFLLNIGFVWLLAVIFLKCLSNLKLPLGKKELFLTLLVAAIFLFANFVPMDYGFYAILFVLIFYYTIFKNQKPFLCVCLTFSTYLYYIFKNYIPVSLKYKIPLIKIILKETQVFSVLAVFLVLIFKKKDLKILPGRFFYWFYPAHIAALVLIKSVFLN